MSDTLPETGCTQVWDFESQIDEVCDLFEAAWKGGGHPRIEDYLKDSPAPARVALLRELIPLDMEYRKRIGETVTEDDYRARFPSWSPEEFTLGPGNTIPLKAGRYLLEDKIGAGGMGEVFRVLDLDLHRSLAVKILLDRHRGRTDLEARFLEEAQILGQLQHPGIVPVHEIGRLDDGRPFFAMKLVRGQTLAKLLGERPRPDHDLPRFLAIFEQVCQTMANAHAHGVIHRDLKPSNVMVGAFGEVQVMDWGLAKVLNRGRKPSDPPAPAHGEIIVTSARTAAPDQATHEGRLIGTLPFMAPEQALGEIDKHDERTDVFLLGGILCAILTGEAPYERTTGLRAQQTSDLQPAFDRLDASEADSELIELAKVCLTADREGRPRDAGAVAERIARYMVAVQERLRAAELARAKAVTKAEEQRKRHRVMWALAGSVSLFVASCAAGVWWWTWQRGHTWQQVELVMNEARLLHVQGKPRQAAEAAKRAVALTEAGPVSADLRQRVLQEAAELDAEAAELDRRRDFLDRLAEVRTSREDEFDESHTDIGYEGVFRSINIDVDELAVEETAEHFRGWPEEELTELAGALDDWAWERRRRMRPASEWQRLVALARAVDRDEWRGTLRTLDYLNIAKERDELLKLAQTAKVLELPPASVELLGRALSAAGAPEEAIVVLQDAQRLHPRDVWLNYGLAEAFKGQEQWSDAVRFYTAARSVRPEIGHALGHALEKLGKNDEATKVFAELVRLRPANPRHHNCLGGSLNRVTQLDDCIRELRKAIDLDPGYAPAHYNLGIALGEKKHLEEAIKEFRTVIDLDPKFPKAHYNLGTSLSKKNQLVEAIREYRTAVDLDPKYVKAYYNLGVALHDNKQMDEAIRVYRKVIDLDPKHAIAHNNLGRALHDKNQVDEAIPEYRTAIDLDPTSAIAHNNLGTALHDKKHFDEAIREFRTAIDLDPRYAKAHNNLGATLQAKGQLDEAIREYRAAIDLDPKNVNARKCLGNALSGKNLLDDAIRELRAAIDIDPKLAAAHNDLGSALYAKKELGEAIREFRTAIDLDPKFAAAHYNLGNGLYATMQLDEAIREFRAAIDLDAKFVNAYFNLGLALDDKKEWDGAIREFRTAIDLDPKYARPHGALGKTLLQIGRFAEARESTRRCLDLMQRNDPLRQLFTWQLRQCDQFLALDLKLAAILEDKEKPGNDAERLALAQLCQKPSKKLYAASCRFYAEAFDHDAILSDYMQKLHRYNAACAAAQAGCGQGKDAEMLDDNDRPRLRKQALDWLRADLALLTKQAESRKSDERAMVMQVLKHWHEDPDLAGIRDKDEMAKLPDVEQEACRKLWADVEAVLKVAQEKEK
jgi:serine/threonine-protein kinase